jgi:hypothetical protein
VTWAKELKKLRRSLRDPDGNIWTDISLRHIYNDIQQDFQKQTKVLEDVTSQRVPQLYHYAYMHDWEYGYVPSKWSQFYQCLLQHGEHVITHRWEAQALAGIDSAVPEYGINFIQPWEAYMGPTLPGHEVKMRFPQNFNSVKYIAYDEEPIHVTTKKMVQSSDPSYVTRTGQAFSYYPYDETDNSYVLYPRPDVSFADDVDGDGVAFYQEGDTESDTTGIIAVRDDSTPSASYGASVDIVGTLNQVFLVYRVSPEDVANAEDEPAFPEFIRKYIRYGVVSRAYSSNTDGKIPSLGLYWGTRYSLGIKFVKQYVLQRRTDRDYRLTTKGVEPRRNRRLPRLPDGYPAI